MNQIVQQPNIVKLEDEQREQMGGAITIEQSRAVQEVMGSILAAKRFPRDEVQAERRIMQACTRPTLAGSAVYSYPRGGQTVTGPSIRLAEVLKQYWGNIDSGWRELERRGNESTLLAYAWDKETNTRAERHITVRQVRDKWEGPSGRKVKVQVPLTDERDIFENNANQAARRMRACILELIPGDIVESAVEECERTLAAKEPVTPENLKGLLKTFEKFSVNKAMIEAFLGRNYESITPAQIVKFRTIYNAIKDGVGEVSDFFDTSLMKESGEEPEQKKPPAEKKKEEKDLASFKEEQKKEVTEPSNLSKKIDKAEEALKQTNKQDPVCGTCHGRGLTETENGKEPCPDCQ